MVGVRLLAAAALLVFLGGCELNSVRPTQGARAFGPFRPAILVLAVDATNWTRRQPMRAVLVRVHEDGSIMGGGCFLYDHTEASVPAATRGRRYFAFEAPPGIYAIARSSNLFCDENGRCSDDGPSAGPWPKAYTLRSGEVAYVADFVATTGNSVVIERNLKAARDWAGNRFSRLPELADVAPNTPAAPPFLCTP